MKPLFAFDDPLIRSFGNHVQHGLAGLRMLYVEVEGGQGEVEFVPAEELVVGIGREPRIGAPHLPVEHRIARATKPSRIAISRSSGISPAAAIAARWTASAANVSSFLVGTGQSVLIRRAPLV